MFTLVLMLHLNWSMSCNLSRQLSKTIHKILLECEAIIIAGRNRVTLSNAIILLGIKENCLLNYIYLFIYQFKLTFLIN